MAAGTDFSRWLVVGRCDETGVGRMAADFLRLFPEMRQAVLPSVRFAQNPVPDTALRIPSEVSDAELSALLDGAEGLVMFEGVEPPNLVRVAAAKRIATVLVPMWEWFHPAFPDWDRVTRFACPNGMCVSILRRLGIRRLHQVGWPMDFSGLPQHRITGPGRVFVHNSGIVETDDRKAVHETIQAFARVKDDRIRLIVRTQNEVPLKVEDPRIEYRAGHLASKRALYEEGDVLVQPSKAEGLGFAILEGMACGFPVITSDYPPMNEYVAERALRASMQWGRAYPVQASYIAHAHLKIPRVRSLARCIAWAARHDLAAVSERNAAWVAREFAHAKLRGEWEALLAECAREARP